MSLINVDNVLSGLGSYGIESDWIYSDLNKMSETETGKALEDYLTREPEMMDFNSNNEAIKFEAKYPEGI